MTMELGPVTRAALEEVAAAIRGRIPSRRAAVAGVITGATRDTASQAIRSATVLVGNQEYDVPWSAGVGAPVGQPVELSYDTTRPATPDWRFERFLIGNQPYPALDDDASIPAPTITALATGTGTPTSGGLQAYLSATILWTEDRFDPERIEVQFASDTDAAAGRWTSLMIAPDPGGAITRDPVTNAIVQAVWIGWLPLGTGYNVKARTWTSAGGRSPFSPVLSRLTAADTTTPAAPASFSVDLSKSLAAIINLPAPSQPLVFDSWEVSIATSNVGAGAQSYRTTTSQYFYSVGAPVTIYVRVREVTKAGVAGPWQPGSGWSGGYSILASGPSLDTTAPNTPVLSTLTQAQVVVQGVTQAVLTATLAAYTFPSPNDFAYFEWRFYNGTSTTAEYPTTATETTYRKFGAEQGATYFVKVRAWDVNGNASPWSNELSVAVPVMQTPSAPTITAATAGFRAVVITWSQVADSATVGVIRSYEVQSSTDGVNFTPLVITDALRYAATGLAIGAVVYFRVRAINTAGIASAWSNVVSATPTAIQDADVIVNTLTGNRIAAGTITGDRIQAGTIDSSRYGPGSITANTLVSDLTLTSKLRAQGPDPGGGRIYAGNDTVLLWQGGLHIAGTQSMKFISGDLETGTVRVALQPVTNYAATGRSGLLIEQPVAGADQNNAVVFLRTRRGADYATNARWLELSDLEIRFVEQTIGFKGIRITSTRYWDPDGNRAHLLTLQSTFVNGSLSGAAGVGVDLMAASWMVGKVPANASAILVRVTITSAAPSPAGLLYVSTSAGGENGLVLIHPGANSQMGIVEINRVFNTLTFYSPTMSWTAFVSVTGYFQ